MYLRRYRCIYVQHSRGPRDIRSFPTRRSSDLQGGDAGQDGDAMGRERREQAGAGELGAAEEDRGADLECEEDLIEAIDRKSTRLNSSHVEISYAVFCLKKKIESN